MNQTNKPIFCFGSNLAGIHGAGAAAYAVVHHGAVYRQGWGLNGTSYAIPTKDRSIRALPLEEIQYYVNRFIDFAKEHPTMVFNMTRIGCGLAGYQDKDIAPMFKDAPINVILPIEWKPFMEEGNHEYIDWKYAL